MSVNHLQMQLNQQKQHADLKAKKIRSRMLDRERDYRTQIQGLEQKLAVALTRWEQLKEVVKAWHLDTFLLEMEKIEHE